MRNLRRSATALVAVIVLSSCVKVDLSLKLGNDAKVSGSFVLAYTAEGLKAMGQTEKQLLVQLRSKGNTPKGAVARPYRKDGWIGVEYRFSGLPAAQFSPNGPGKDDPADPNRLHFEKVDRLWRFSGGIDPKAGGAPDPKAADAFARKPEILMAVTFPTVPTRCGGDTTAVISGNTATWELSKGLTSPICVEARV